MGTTTGIEWTDATWNPIRGCSRVSEGCRNCYAESVAYRFSGPGQPYEGLAHRVNGHAAWTGEVRFVEKHLLDPLRWKGKPIYDATTGERVGYRPMRIFVNSMSDLFHENVKDEWIDKIFAVMALCRQHRFQVLTKRPARMLAYLATPNRVMPVWMRMGGDWPLRHGCGEPPWPLPNIWLGVSCEHQAAADERIPLLLRTPAAVRFISAEPLLGPISLEELPSVSGIGRYLDALSNAGVDPGADIPTKLDWVIVGGESGPGARPMHPDWARSLRDQCRAAEVPFFFKQWGCAVPGDSLRGGEEAVPNTCCLHRDGFIDIADCCSYTYEDTTPEDGAVRMHKASKKAAGAMLDGREWREFPVA